MKFSTAKALDMTTNPRYLLLDLLKVTRLTLKHGPIDMISELKRYPWITIMIQVYRLMFKLTRGRTGLYRKANAMLISEVVTGVVEMLEGLFFHKDRVVMHEDMVPPEIIRAMGLAPFLPESIGLLLPMIHPGAMEPYIDSCESEGIPPDTCSLPKCTMGTALDGHLPDAKAVVTSNLPCDGGMSSYNVIEQKLKVPTYRLDIPYHFYSKEAVCYFVEELRDMIKWLEVHTPGKMNWDKLKQICTQRNKMVELEMELWDMVRQKPSPMAGEPIYLSHLWSFNVAPGRKSSTRLFQKIVDVTRTNLKRGISAVPNETYRVLLWNTPIIHFVDLFSWAEKTYGVALIMDMMSFNRLPYIDTSSEQGMLEGLARNIMQGPMARHTRGPAQNYYEDMFHIYRHFDLDMIWVSGHVGCKNAHALMGILREKCREAKIPLLIIDNDILDSRIVTHENIKNQVKDFMENIMKAKPLTQG